MIFSAVRFAADMILYPEITSILTPHILANLLRRFLINDEFGASKTRKGGQETEDLFASTNGHTV